MTKLFLQQLTSSTNISITPDKQGLSSSSSDGVSVVAPKGILSVADTYGSTAFNLDTNTWDTIHFILRLLILKSCSYLLTEHNFFVMPLFLLSTLPLKDLSWLYSFFRCLLTYLLAWLFLSFLLFFYFFFFPISLLLYLFPFFFPLFIFLRDEVDDFLHIWRPCSFLPL